MFHGGQAIFRVGICLEYLKINMHECRLGLISVVGWGYDVKPNVSLKVLGKHLKKKNKCYPLTVGQELSCVRGKRSSTVHIAGCPLRPLNPNVSNCHNQPHSLQRCIRTFRIYMCIYFIRGLVSENGGAQDRQENQESQ